MLAEECEELLKWRVLRSVEKARPLPPWPQRTSPKICRCYLKVETLARGCDLELYWHGKLGFCECSEKEEEEEGEYDKGDEEEECGEHGKVQDEEDCEIVTCGRDDLDLDVSSCQIHKRTDPARFCSCQVPLRAKLCFFVARRRAVNSSR